MMNSIQNVWLVVAPGMGPQTAMSEAHPNGVVATLFSSEELAAQAASGDYKVLPLGSLWETRVLAGEGYAGLLLDGRIPILWVSTDPKSALPTHIAIPEGKEYWVMDATGVTTLTREDVEPWQNLPKFDQRTNTALLGNLPFYGYQPDMPLYEYMDNAADTLTLAPTGGALLQQAGDAQEAVAFFSTPFSAEWYWEQIGVRLTGVGDVAQEIASRDDIIERLNALDDLPDDVALILNPGRHRFYQGFFRYLDGQWFLITINGLWQVASPFRLTQVAKRSQA